MSTVFAKGFSTGSVHVGITALKDKKDLAIVVNNGPSDVAAGVFTSNRFAAAPVIVSKEIIADGKAKAVLINSGGANACTGEKGIEQSRICVKETAAALNLKEDEVLVASTGLIGELLPVEKMISGIKAAAADLSDSAEYGIASAKAIMTTDTKYKTVEIQADGYRVGGMVKGSGMIAPSLATMICVITTDADVTAEQAQKALKEAASVTFDRIDVDGCMSTNDTVLLLSSAASGVKPDFEDFKEKIKQACSSLSRQIIGDGEGATHDIKITVSDATSEEAALACARAVAASNLLKCAICGNDPNWGRVVSSLGTVPEETAPYDPSKVTVDINSVRVCDGGKPGLPRALVQMAQNREVQIDICLNTGGNCEATVWTDDLTLDYVHINADYES